MQKNKQISIQVRVDKKIADELHRRAKQKQILFSSYVRRVLTNEAKKGNKNDNRSSQCK